MCWRRMDEEWGEEMEVMNLTYNRCGTYCATGCVTRSSIASKCWNKVLIMGIKLQLRSLSVLPYSDRHVDEWFEAQAGTIRRWFDCTNSIFSAYHNITELLVFTPGHFIYSHTCYFTSFFVRLCYISLIAVEILMTWLCLDTNTTRFWGKLVQVC